MFEILGLIVIGLIPIFVHYLQRRLRRDDIAFLGKQYGYRFHDELTLGDFSEYGHPPWHAFPRWEDCDRAFEVLVLKHADAEIFSFNVFARIAGHDTRPKDMGPVLVSVVGMKPKPGVDVSAMALFAGERLARNGVRVVDRGGCFYAMVMPSLRRSVQMDYRERIDCMRGMTRMLEGRFDDADAVFNKIWGDSVTRALLALPLIYVTCYYLTRLAVIEPQARLPMLAAGVVLALLILYTRSQLKGDEELKNYL